MKFNLHSLFSNSVRICICLNKAKLDSEQHIRLQHRLTVATEVCYSCTRQSYKTARAYSEPCLVEGRLSFAVEVTTVSGNWKQDPLPSKINFSVSFQWLLF